MPTEKPGVVEREDGGHLTAEPRQFAQVEVTAVQVVTMEDRRTLRRQFQQATGPWKGDVLMTASRLQPTMRLGDPPHQTLHSTDSAHAAGKGLQSLATRVEGSGPKGTAMVVRDLQDPGTCAPIPSDGPPGCVAPRATRLEEAPCDLLRSAGEVLGVDLQNSQPIILAMH